MKRSVIFFSLAALLIALSPLVYQAKNLSAKNEKEIIRCITQYGWETDGVLRDTAKYKIPDPLSDVFEEYNKIQIRSGFDLNEYRGKTVTRYTYKILNHKNSGKNEVFCNILVYEGKMIAADIMTTAINGFMHGITETKYIQKLKLCLVHPSDGVAGF
jgi:hypothetical protein